MTAAAVVALALLLLEDDNLAAALVFEDGRFDHRAFDEWLSSWKPSPSPTVRTSLISSFEPASVSG